MTFDAIHPCPDRSVTPAAAQSCARTRPHGTLSFAALLACTLVLCGCGSSGRSAATHPASVPAHVIEPFTPEQKLIEQGAPLMVADGCSACHLSAAAGTGAPSFASFAGHRVKLVNGRSVLVDERFVREGLLDPRANELSGYDPEPMLAALARLHLASHSGQVAALAAFIEQIGPEPE